jgi:hypothetical protein
VINPQDAAVLEGLIRREGRSLLQYVSASFPWVRTGTGETLAKLQRLTREENDAVGALSRFLARRGHAAPYLGAYPMAFTTMNYVSLDHLLPRLLEHQRRAVAALEADRAALADAGARAEVDRVLEMKRRHLQTLEALAGSAAPAAG